MKSIFSSLLILTLGLTLLSPRALSITRVGGGSVQSVIQGYELRIPIKFDTIHLYADDKARFQENMAITTLKQSHMQIGANGGFGGIGGIGNGIMPSFIDLRIFSEEFPEYATLNAAELTEKLIANGWTRITNPNSCVITFAKESSTASFALTTWGSGKGIVLVGDKSDDVHSAIYEMLSTLKLLEGACQWK